MISSSENNISGIYCIENIINNKKYIGRATNINIRFTRHKSELRFNKHRNDHLQKAWNKYGEENFKFYLIEECPKELLSDLEIEIIEYYQTKNPKFGYNKTDGGEGTIGHKHTKEARLQMTKRRHSQETKEKISKNRSGITPILKNISRENLSDKISKAEIYTKKSGNNKHIGVYFRKVNKFHPWTAIFSMKNGERRNIGSYKTEKEAIDVWEDFYFNYIGKPYVERFIKKESEVN